ncbi:hypothetical protein TSAR_005306, partial [Trichomalopsis sarcophagae]
SDLCVKFGYRVLGFLLSCFLYSDCTYAVQRGGFLGVFCECAKPRVWERTGWMIEGRTDAPGCSRVTLILHFSHTSTHVCQQCGSRLILVECLCDREGEEATSGLVNLVSGIQVAFAQRVKFYYSI